MNKESQEGCEIPSSILFHGTTLTRYQQFLRPDGSYQSPYGEKIWFDENSEIPLNHALFHGKVHNDEKILLLARSDMLSLENHFIRVPGSLSLSIYRFWTTDRLPSHSFVQYNLTKNELGIFGTNDLAHHIEKIRELCEPLGVLPDCINTLLPK